jgi:mono/diheme cytochrome c family protein
MADHSCVRYGFLLSGLLLLLNPACRSVSAQAPDPQAAAALFGQYCVKCHGPDGSGSPVRDVLPDIPNFAKVSWQRRRFNAELVTSILDGEGRGMPAFRGKINEDQARGLVRQIRSFAPTPGRERPEQRMKAPRDFEQEFHQLEKELRELQRQFRKLSEG